MYRTEEKRVITNGAHSFSREKQTKINTSSNVIPPDRQTGIIEIRLVLGSL